jgi:hypothetical protein
MRKTTSSSCCAVAAMAAVLMFPAAAVAQVPAAAAPKTEAPATQAPAVQVPVAQTPANPVPATPALVAAPKDALPDGWERPIDADLAGPNLKFRQNKPQRFLRADGDFDGDGQADRAEILVNRQNRTFAVYAFASKLPAPIELADGNITDVGRMGISAAKPGRTMTACGKGYDVGDPGCKKGVPFIYTPFPSIEYFGFESGGSQFYWNGGKFEHIRTSD